MKFDEVVTKFENLQSRMDSAISGFNPEDVRTLADALANSSFNEDKLVETIAAHHAREGSSGTD